MADKRLGYHNNPSLPLPQSVVSLTQEQEDEMMKCMDDPVYFVKTYMKIVKPGEGLISFDMWPFQEKMMHTFQHNRFTICKNPRQSGKSITMIAYILWLILFNENYYAGIIADKGFLARELLARLKLAYEWLPNWLKQGVVVWNKGDIELSNGSKVKTYATGSRSAAGSSLDLVYLDEFAHVPNNQAEDFFAATYPVISAGKDTRVIITSTPKGLNLFYNMWEKARLKENAYVPIDVHWSEVPGRDQAWKEETIANTSEEQFRQEFETEFIGSNNTLISSSKLIALLGIPTILKEEYFDVYEIPKEGHTYVLAVDTAEGLNKDYSAFSVIDATSIPYRQIAKYRNNKIDPLIYASVVYNVAMRFNEAFVLIEINSIGLQVASVLYNDYAYDNLLKVDNKSNVGLGQHVTAGYSQGIQLGVKMSPQVKRIGCTNLKMLIENDKLITNDNDTIYELRTFAAQKNSYAAEEGRHDDLAMTLVIFSWFATQQYFRNLLDQDVRNVVQEEKLRLVEKTIPPVYIPKIDDPYSTKWKDQNGDIWTAADNDGFDSWFNKGGW